MSRTHGANQTQSKLYLDVALAAAFLVSLRPFLTGLAVHEWLGLAIGGGLAVHMILHWKWAIGVTRKLLGGLGLRTRLYYALDLALLVAFVTIIGSGVAMSRVVLPLAGIQGSRRIAWVGVHKAASYLTLCLVGAKLLLHRRWIANAVRGHLPGLGRPASLRSNSTPLVGRMPESAEANRSTDR